MASYRLVLMILMAAFEFSFCLECHHCTTIENGKECKKPKDNSFLIDCAVLDSYNFNVQYVLPHASSLQDGVAGARRYCHKVVTKAGHIFRTCLDTDPTSMQSTCDFLKTDPDSRSKIKSCTVCGSPGCNGSSGVAGSLSLVLSASISFFSTY